ncbi:hypothetical protein GCK72_014526 [Caenorhabditis remanei]|uniref:Kelch domain-containing protein 10 n=1 Tax=Caenorhabditis remanei TaxID=31234 RepID=A0A6A5GRI7_CAERE|nr:hypothetical protein GCK72_014526 [Caenorhabditis remanei]KAF1758068.1 hypothetical protein GCK72_014526 [Caenorhabditis remanei]
MVNLIGWFPDAHNADPGTSYLNNFIAPFGPIKKKEKDYPAARSGHRCFTDNDYLYVIGGFTHQFRNGSIFKEFWSMSLATFEWRRYEVIGDFPETLASFSIVQMFPFSKTFILFGGSGTDFGQTSSNSFYFIRINNDNCSIESQKIDVQGTIPPPVYGHAMCAGEIPGKFYIIGGTEGILYNFDVHALTMRANSEAKNDNEKFSWHCELVTKNLNFAGRYRMEATYDEVKNVLIFFGGGNNEEMAVLDVQSRVCSEVSTHPDSVNGFPLPRRCHTIVRHGRKVIMTGGINHTTNVNEIPLHSDVWIFNMENYSWTKYNHSLPKSVFFHSSAITEDGWMLIFGGAHGIATSSPRNNRLLGAWFGVPRLQRFALETLRKEYPNHQADIQVLGPRPQRRRRPPRQPPQVNDPIQNLQNVQQQVRRLLEQLFEHRFNNDENEEDDDSDLEVEAGDHENDPDAPFDEAAEDLENQLLELLQRPHRNRNPE